MEQKKLGVITVQDNTMLIKMIDITYV